MIPSNFHTHTTFCDGKDTPEQLVLYAIAQGCPSIGFSGHSYTFFDERYCMSQKGTEEYKECIRQLKIKYADQIQIFLGVEQDYYSTAQTEDYDYVIGSVHYLQKDGVYLPVDESRELQIRAVEEHYNGDFYAYAEHYYQTVADLYQKTHCDIIGHFDLVTKYNDDGSLFDVTHPRYIMAAKRALETLLQTPVTFEINTGGMARGHKSQVYPAPWMLSMLHEAGAKTICTSDCHAKEFLLFGL